MASVSITNQTLTMTITIDGVDTVIRKDNCKVQAFGDVVRITDYKGSIYEFLYSDCTSPSEASANDLRDAIEEFLNTGGGGGGLGYNELVIRYTSTDGTDNGTAVIVSEVGDFGNVTLSRSDGYIGIVSDQNVFTLGKTVAICSLVNDDLTISLGYGISYLIDTIGVVALVNSDSTPWTGILGDPNNPQNYFCSFVIRVYP